MNIYSIPPLIGALFSLVLGLFVFLKNKRSEQNISFLLMCLIIFTWLSAYTIAYSTNNIKIATICSKTACTAVIFLATTFYYFIIAFLKIKKEKIVVKIFYIISFILLYIFIFTDYFLSGVYKYYWGYYSKAGILHPLFLIFFFSIFIRGILLLFKSLKYQKELSPTKRNQIKYLLIGLLIIGFGGIDFVPKYGIEIYPFGFLFILIFISITAYAIIKHHFMDIRVAITRAGIFIFVYSLVFGLPFIVGYIVKSWFIPTFLAVLLASPSPFIYNYLRTQAEMMLLKDQFRYQAVLRGIAQTILKVRELEELLKVIFQKVNSALEPEFIGLYIFSKEKNLYILKYNQTQSKHNLPKDIPLDSSLINSLSQNKKSIFIPQDNLNLPFETISIPFFSQDTLFSFLILGPKPKKSPYLESDLIAFDILSSQASLAIENCIFWQEERIRLAKEEQLKRQRTMDHFSASLAHEIDNPIFAIITLAGVIKTIILEELKENIPLDKLSLLTDRLNRIENDLLRISKMIKSIREFSSQTKGEQTILNFSDVIEDFLNIVEPQFKYEGIVFKKEIEQNIKLKGNKIHLEEILINFATNSIHAVKYNNKKEIVLKVYRNTPKTFIIEFKDNGYGIEQYILEDIFLDFVTTKASSEGSGMGLARVRKIVENHNGRVWAYSEGKDKGATFFVELPLAI